MSFVDYPSSVLSSKPKITGERGNRRTTTSLPVRPSGRCGLPRATLEHGTKVESQWSSALRDAESSSETAGVAHLKVRRFSVLRSH